MNGQEKNVEPSSRRLENPISSPPLQLFLLCAGEEDGEGKKPPAENKELKRIKRTSKIA
jgi:hypothetical protein